MPSVRYYNQTAPFWDFVASMEEQGPQHPFFAANNNRGEESDNDNQHPNPWTEGWGGFPFGPFAHRGRHGPPHGPPHHHHHHRQHSRGPPPPEHEGPPGPPEKEHDPEEGPSGPPGPPPPFSEEPHHGPGPKHKAGPHHGPPHHGPPHHGPGAQRGRCGGRGRGGRVGRGRDGPFGPRGFGGFGGLADMFHSQLFGEDGTKQEGSEDFTPEVDVFDTAEYYVVHVSLPGAKKEDVGLSYDAEKSELSITGVTYRPGDEDLLKTLALDERKVGAFERKVRLGSRANPAQVDVEGISAKLEDGVLRVDVPKLDSGYVEIKRVDIE